MRDTRSRAALTLMAVAIGTLLVPATTSPAYAQTTTVRDISDATLNPNDATQALLDVTYICDAGADLTLQVNLTQRLNSKVTISGTFTTLVECTGQSLTVTAGVHRGGQSNPPWKSGKAAAEASLADCSSGSCETVATLSKDIHIRNK